MAALPALLLQEADLQGLSLGPTPGTLVSLCPAVTLDKVVRLDRQRTGRLSNGKSVTCRPTKSQGLTTLGDGGRLVSLPGLVYSPCLL